MSTQTYESVPTTWLDERDVPFFRLTAGLFDPAFADGAGVLLASYDADEPAARSLPARSAAQAVAHRTATTDLTAPVKNN
jgi:hypothetical protein